MQIVPMNKGQMLHEMVRYAGGTQEACRADAQAPGMEDDEAHLAHVKPGRGGRILWQLTQSGELLCACLPPGHFEAGVVGKVTVRQCAAMPSGGDRFPGGR